MPDPINFHKHHMQMHGPDISMGGKGWLIEGLVLAHVVAVCLFWAWLLCRQQSGGKPRRSVRPAGPKAVHIQDDWLEIKSANTWKAL